VRALSKGEGQQKQAACHEAETHEHGQGDDFQRALLGPSDASVAMITASELAGMSAAASHGVIQPARQSATAPAL
jgi:hypothetical protein